MSRVIVIDVNLQQVSRIAVTDLNRLTHALLMAKCDYVSNSICKKGDAWKFAYGNIQALDELYEQLEAVLINTRAEATANEPEVAITDAESGVTEVIATRGDVWGGMPHAKEDVQ